MIGDIVRSEASEKLESLLNQGHTFIEARRFTDEMFDTDNSYTGWFLFDSGTYPDDYFLPTNEGIEYFKVQNMKKYKKLPSVGIILRDGTIFRVKSFHMELACWLKFNKIDLEGSLRFVFFPDTKRFSIVEGYDFKDKIESANLNELCCAWNAKYDGENLNYDIELTEEQAVTIFHLSQQYKLDFEDVLLSNHGLRMNQLSSASCEQKRVGKRNNDTVNSALRRI